MGFKDPEKEREYQRNLMRRRREEAKSQVSQPPGEAESGVTSLPGPVEDSIRGESGAAIPPGTPKSPAAVINSPPKPPPAPPAPPPPTQDQLDEASAVSSISMDELYHGRGWVIWNCRNFDKNIVLIRDKTVMDFPAGMAVLTIEELKRVCQLPDLAIHAYLLAKEMGLEPEIDEVGVKAAIPLMK